TRLLLYLKSKLSEILMPQSVVVGLPVNLPQQYHDRNLIRSSPGATTNKGQQFLSQIIVDAFREGRAAPTAWGASSGASCPNGSAPCRNSCSATSRRPRAS